MGTLGSTDLNSCNPSGESGLHAVEPCSVAPRNCMRLFCRPYSHLILLILGGTLFWDLLCQESQRQLVIFVVLYALEGFADQFVIGQQSSDTAPNGVAGAIRPHRVPLHFKHHVAPQPDTNVHYDTISTRLAHHAVCLFTGAHFSYPGGMARVS